MVAFNYIFSICHGPPLSYLYGKKLRNKKKLMLIQIMNSVGLNSKNIVNNANIFIDIGVMNSHFKESYWYE